jgi:predicted phage-related endonuclease
MKINAKPYVTATDAEWKALRKQIITATESAYLLGLDSWKSAAKMLKEKEEEFSLADNPYLFLGRSLEQAVVDYTNKALERDFKLFETEAGKIIYADLEVGLGATPDAQEGDVLLECKTTGPKNHFLWADSPPIKYLAQLQTQLLCTNRTEGFLAILLTNLAPDHHKMTLKEYLSTKLHVFKCEIDLRFADILLAELVRLKEYRNEGIFFRSDPDIKDEAIGCLNSCYEKVIF